MEHSCAKFEVDIFVTLFTVPTYIVHEPKSPYLQLNLWEIQLKHLSNNKNEIMITILNNIILGFHRLLFFYWLVFFFSFCISLLFHYDFLSCLHQVSTVFEPFVYQA